MTDTAKASVAKKKREEEDSIKRTLFSPAATGAPSAASASARGDDAYYYDDDNDDDDTEPYYDFRGGAVVAVPAAQANPQGPSTSTLQKSIMDKKVLAKIRIPGFGSDDDDDGGAAGSSRAAGGASRQRAALAVEDVAGAAGAAKANQRVLNQLLEATTMAAAPKHALDKAERATVENVMDPRTRLLLYKLVNSGLLECVNGCVSTGKEANVYYAVGGDKADLAIKIFKTSILVFKDREKYVTGEYRFQRFCKSNPRKMVRTWAEKEARNLHRLLNGGVRVPKVLLLRQHIIIMEFIGHDGWPAPRLKDVRLSPTGLARAYFDIVVTMRRMYLDCRLVHGDLSEYNLLYHDGEVVLIDVSQSVEHDHPQSMNFLRRDIANVNAFFRGKGLIARMPLQELFNFVTNSEDPIYRRPPAEFFSDNLQRWETLQRERDVADEVDEKVFLAVHVPRTLGDISEVKKMAKDTQGFLDSMLARGQEKKGGGRAAEDDEDEEAGEDEEDEEDADAPPALPVVSTTGSKPKPTAIDSGARKHASVPPRSKHDDPAAGAVTKDPAAGGGDSTPASSSDDEDGGSSNDDDDDDDGREAAREHRLTAGGPLLATMTKEERKAHKAAVKAEKREQRAQKMPKHKKRKACKGHQKSHK